MLKLLADSVRTYIETARLILIFGFLVFAVVLFLTNFSTYVVAGAGFLKYSSILDGTVSLLDLSVFLVISLLSLFCLAFLSVGVTMVVKLKQSLDDVEFFKLIARFPKHLIKLMVWWMIIGIITFFLALSFNAINAPPWFSALIMLFLWAFFIFIPQSLVLHEKDFFPALKDSATYCIKRPGAILVYYVLSCFLLFVLVCIDVLFGQFFSGDFSLSWIAAIINSALLFIVFIPFLEIVKANVFVTRYGLLTLGLK